MTRFTRCLARGSAALALSLLPSSALAKQELGLNTHQSTTVGLDATRDAGLGWVRIDLNWFNAEPSEGVYDFSLFDAIVDGASARGLSVLAVVGYTPEWASSGDLKGGGALNDVPKEGTYAAFVTAAVQHFQGKITHYELWNEPNLEQFFEGTPDDYTKRVLVPGAAAVHAACPSCMVIAPGLATVGGKYDVWMDAALSAAKDQIDIVSGHVYADFGLGMSADNFFNKLERHRVLKSGDVVVFEGPLSFKEVMDKHGVTKPFWLTETGREAPLGDATALDAQVTFYRHVLENMPSRPWWAATIFYEAFDEPNGGYSWGVVMHDDTKPGGYEPKPVFPFLKKVALAQKAFGGNKPDCDDGLDNDSDGFIDYPADPDCTSVLATSEGEPPPDGGLGGAGGAGGG
ncbi:MAG: beta-galactosidase, partial [Byssovorax sp.]